MQTQHKFSPFPGEAKTLAIRVSTWLHSAGGRAFERPIEMTTETKHTPTPWRVGLRNGVFGADEFIGGDRHYQVVCTPTSGGIYRRHSTESELQAEAEANAAFIVRSCNAHDALVSALKGMRLALDSIYMRIDGDLTPAEATCDQQARAALALAEGGAK